MIMSTEHPPETVVEHPTYFGNIRNFFEREDKDCMRCKAFEPMNSQFQLTPANAGTALGELL